MTFHISGCKRDAKLILVSILDIFEDADISSVRKSCDVDG